MKKRIFSLVTLVLLLAGCILPMNSVKAQSSNNTLVVDEAHVLSDSELGYLNEWADNIRNVYDYDVTVLFAADLQGEDAMDYADNWYDYNGYGKDGIILLVCPDSRDYWLSGSGEAIQMFDENRMEKLEDAAVSKLRNSDWFGAAESFYENCDKFLSQGMPKKHINWFMLPISAIIGFVGAYLPMGGLRSQLKSVSRRTDAAHYIVESQGIDVTHTNDRLINTSISRRPITTTRSGGGGGNGVHTSSSGNTHSGRGGKF